VPARERRGVDPANGETGKVKYEDVQLEECLDLLTAPEALGWRCPACGSDVVANKVAFLRSLVSWLYMQRSFSW